MSSGRVSTAVTGDTPWRNDVLGAFDWRHLRVIVDTWRVGVGIKQLSRACADNGGMRISIICALLAIAACSKPNPGACCTTQEQCDVVGLDGITGCKAENVCDPNGACVAKECSTSADCTSPDKPVCINELCVAKCMVDDDCTGLVGTPHCGADGVCVACVDDTQCATDAPVCDSQARACRGCAADAECPSGVCLEADGRCADSQEILYLRADGSDAGDCEQSAPCKTFGYAFQKVSSTRTVVHILGTTLNVGSGTIDLPSRSIYIDGEDTVLQSAGSAAVFTANFGTAAISRITVGGVSGQNSFAVGGGTLHLYDLKILSPIVFSAGTLMLAKSAISGGLFGIDCSGGGVLSVEESAVHTRIRTDSCPTTIRRSTFDNTGGALNLGGSAVVTVENNLFTSTDYYTDEAFVSGAAGSTVRFNTFVNTSGVDMGSQSLGCTGAVDVTSNIFAWHTDNAPSNCSPRYSLFDTTVGIQPGVGNKVGDPASFFVDLPQADFHLAPGSPAIDAAEAGLPVDIDLDGHARPNGSAPDMGAYEAP